MTVGLRGMVVLADAVPNPTRDAGLIDDGDV